jgi:hypothetical protein
MNHELNALQTPIVPLCIRPRVAEAVIRRRFAPTRLLHPAYRKSLLL